MQDRFDLQRRVCHGCGAAAVVAIVLLAACKHSTPPTGQGGVSNPLAANALAQCAMHSAYLQVGAGLDAPSQRLESPGPPVGTAPVCAGNHQFRFGSGLYDITGVVANTSGMGWESPTQVFSGLQQRQYARAFVIESPCNGRRVAFVSTDTGMIFGSVRQYVLDAIAADPELAKSYGPDNVMLSATHTHEGPAGYSHYEAFNTFHFGFDPTTFEAIADGVFQAIRRAHANLRAHPDTAAIPLAVGELLNTNINRSQVAFDLNPKAERREFLDSRGEPVTTDKRVVQLSLTRGDGSAVGVINWFGVHPTIIGENLTLVSSDMKGYASLGLEKIMKARYAAEPGPDSFVAAFAQADEGDASPNLLINERPYPDPTRGGGKDEYESAAISGTKQLAKALELYGQGQPLAGPVDYRLFHVKMDAVTVTDPVVLDSLHHPASMDAPVKRTCTAALGPSFGAGAEDGPGPATEGLSCKSSPDLLAAGLADVQTLLNFNSTNPAAHILPLTLISAAALCDISKLPALPLADFTCHAEKPVALPVGAIGAGPFAAEPAILPLQIFRIGNLALVGIPWEVTTMSARRIRKMMLDTLAPAGIDTVVVAGLVNDYVHYLPTREEYSSQQYEGASDIFGPWTLAAVQQELRKLAATLRDGTPAPDGRAYVDATPLIQRTPYLAYDLPEPGRKFGDTISDVPATAKPGDTVHFTVQGGHPRNDLKTQSSYVYAEHQKADGSWEVIAEDRDPELWFVWHPAIPSPLPVEVPQVGPSTSEAVWHIPRNTPPGTYRLRVEGAAQTSVLTKTAYSGLSNPFTITGPAADCP